VLCLWSSGRSTGDSKGAKANGKMQGMENAEMGEFFSLAFGWTNSFSKHRRPTFVLNN